MLLTGLREVGVENPPVDWVRRTVDRSEGLPLVIRKITEEAAGGVLAETSAWLPHGLSEEFARDVQRLSGISPFAVDLAALLAMVYEPLSDEDIAGVAQWLPRESIEAVLCSAPWVFARPGRDPHAWALKYEPFREYLSVEAARDGSDCCVVWRRMRHSLMTWLDNWGAHRSRYALAFLARHLAEDGLPRQVIDLARDSAFREAQRSAFPDRPDRELDSVAFALQQAAASGWGQEVIELAFLHAERVTECSHPAAIEEAMEGGQFALAWNLAGRVEEGRDERLWKLLIGISAAEREDEKTAGLLMAEVVELCRRPRWEGWQESSGAIALAAAVKVGALRFETDAALSVELRGLASAIFGSAGRCQLGEALLAMGVARDVVDLLSGDESAWALRLRFRALGACGRVDAVKESASHSRNSESALEAAVRGLAEAGHVDSANEIASMIEDPNRRAGAFLTTAAIRAEHASREDEWSEVCQIVDKAIALRTNAPRFVPGQGYSHDGLRERIEAFGELTVQHGSATSRVNLLSRLGVLQQAAGLPEPAHLALAQTLAMEGSGTVVEDAPRQDTVNQYALLQLILALAETGDIHGAERLVTRLPRNLKKVAWQAVSHSRMRELVASGTPSPETRTFAERCGIALELCRRQALPDAVRLLGHMLVDSHSETMDAPGRWGRPRVLGAIACALYRRGETADGKRIVNGARKLIGDLAVPTWRMDGAYALLNLGTALLSTGRREAVEDGLDALRQGRAAGRISGKPSSRAQVLAMIARVMREYGIRDEYEVVNEAVEALSGAPEAERVAGLVAIAREQAAGNRQAAWATIDEATREAYSASSQAEVLLGRALCGFADGLEEDINTFRARAGRTEVGAVLDRAEVTRQLMYNAVEKAEQIADRIEFPAVKARALRDVARTTAANGCYGNTLRIAGRISVSRGEMLPNIVVSALMQPGCRGAETRTFTEQMLALCLPHLDAVYRMAAVMIRYDVYEELDRRALLALAEFVKQRER